MGLFEAREIAMLPVAGKRQRGGKESADAPDHEESRPPDKRYKYARIRSNLWQNRSRELAHEHPGACASWMWERVLDSEETCPPFLDGFQLRDEEILESVDAMGRVRFGTTESHNGSGYKGNLPQDRMVALWAGILAETKGRYRTGMREKKYLNLQPENGSQRQRAWLVRGIWACIETVRKISNSLLVNKPQCEHIADHFEATSHVLNELGLGESFVSGDGLEGGSGIPSNLTFDETRFDRIAEAFEKHVDDLDSSRTTKIHELSRKFEEYMIGLPGMPASREKSLSPLSSRSVATETFNRSWSGGQALISRLSSYRVEHHLDEFLCLLFGVLKHGEDLVLFHSGLEGVNNGVPGRTGLCGKKFVEIHELLYELLDFYACLEHCRGTEFARGYLPQLDSCAFQSFLYYSTSNCFGENSSLDIDGNLLRIENIEVATRIAEVVKDPNCSLRSLFIQSWPGVKLNPKEFHKGCLMIISALSESVCLTSLTFRGSNGKEVRELCKSLRANRVLMNVVISTDGPLADIDAMDLSAMLKENYNLRRFILQFDNVSPEGVVYLGAMLSEISLAEISITSRKSGGFMSYFMGLSMPHIDRKDTVFLSLEDGYSYFEICRSLCIRPESAMHSSNTQQLRICKTENRLSIKFQDLDRDAVCRVLDFLRKTRSLEILELDYCQILGDDREVLICLEALFAEKSILRELKVKFRAWDKCFLKHLLRCLMVEKGGEPPVEIFLRKLHIINDHGGEMIFRDDWVEVAESMAQMLRTNKTLSHFSLTNACLRTCDICEIVDSLKTNKALRVLDFGIKSQVFGDLQAKVAFIDLLVNHNFSLNMISACGQDMDIETFMKRNLSFDSEISLRGLRSLVCTTSDSPILGGAHDLMQVAGTLQLEEGSTEEVSGSSKRAFDKHKSKVEAKDERPQLLLSYSEETRDFAMKLCMQLKSSNYDVFDQDSSNCDAIVDQCELAIVVLSDMYLNSKSSMSELCTIVKSKRTNNPALKIYPLFYWLTLQDLQNACVPTNTFGRERVLLDFMLEREALDFLCERKNEISRKTNSLIENLSQRRVDVGKFCEEFGEFQRRSWPSNGLEFEKNATSEEGYLQAILEEIFHHMPVGKEGSSGALYGPLPKLEVESKLSLQQMRLWLESLPMTNFYLLRKLNMPEYLQEKYIQYSSFEEMCLFLAVEKKLEYSEGRIAAALFPSTFLYHSKAYMCEGSCGGNFPRMLNAVGKLVAKKMQRECLDNGDQMLTFFDFVDHGAPLDAERTIFAMSQNFSEKVEDGFEDLVIVQDALTGAYYYQCGQAVDPAHPPVPELTGVIGVQVTSEEIYIDNIHEDGSSYSGVLEDFSYKIKSDERKQCAAKAFGDLRGARFLSKDSGIKCSPLLVIALASAVQKKGLTLTWRNGEGHVEFYPKLAQKVKLEVEACACQIQYTSNANELGVEVEWGTNTNICVSQDQTFQRGMNEAVNQRALGSEGDRNVVPTISEDVATTSVHCPSRRANDIAAYSAATQNKSTRSLGIQGPGCGFNVAYEKPHSKAKEIVQITGQRIMKDIFESEGGYDVNPNLDVDYPNLRSHLLNGQLHEVHDCNYLVVSNVHEVGHVSVYRAIERNEAVPKYELTWIADIGVGGGEEEIKRIFEIGLKGREMIVRREATTFTQVENELGPSRWFMSKYGECLLNVKRRLSSNTITSSMNKMPESNLGGKLKSKNEWERIIGPQGQYAPSHKYWWNATPMESIVYSRTLYTSGSLLTTRIELPPNVESHIGFIDIDEGLKEKYGHYTSSIISRGKFSRPPGSQLGSKVFWGGYEIEAEELSHHVDA